MSTLFFEACELCKNSDINGLDALIEHYDINIHEKEDLLLYIAAEQYDVDMVLFLLKKGANPQSRAGAWFYYTYTLLEQETFEYYFFNYIKNIEQNKENAQYNLFDIPYVILQNLKNYGIDFFDYVKFFIDNDYPMSSTYAYSLTLNFNYPVVAYLKSLGKFESVIRKAFYVDKKIKNFCFSFENEDSFFEYINSVYNQFPYHIDDKMKKILENKEFDKLQTDKHSLRPLTTMPLDLFKSFHDTYPAFLEYVIKKNGYDFLYWIEVDKLKIILNGQDLRKSNPKEQYTGEKISAVNIPSDKICYIVSHTKLDDVLLYDLFVTGAEDIQQSIINQYDVKTELDQLNYLAYLCHRHQLANTTLELVRQKINTTEQEKQFFDACLNNNFELIDFFIAQGINVNCEKNSALYFAINAQHNDLINLLVKLSEKNAHTFSIVLEAQNIDYIKPYLKHSFPLGHYLEDIFSLENEELVQCILKHKKQDIEKELLDYIKPLNYIHHSFNLESCLFLSSYFETITKHKPYFAATILAYLIRHSAKINNSIIVPLLHLYVNNLKSDHANYVYYNLFGQLGNFITSDNVELLNYCYEQNWSQLSNHKFLNSASFGMSDKPHFLSEKIATYLLSKIPQEHACYKYALKYTFENKYLSLFYNAINCSTFDFVTFFIENFQLMEDDDMAYCSLFDSLFEKITLYQKDKILLLEDKAHEISSTQWKSIEMKIKAYYEQEKLNAILNEESIVVKEKEDKKKGKI